MQRFFTLIVLFAVIISFTAFGQDNTDNQLTPRRDNARLGGAPGTLEFDLQGHTSPIYLHQWSPDGTKILTASRDGVVIIWSSETGVKLQTMRTAEFVTTFEVKWSPDGQDVVTVDRKGNVKVWSAMTGALRLILLGHTAQVNCVNWSPDGTKIASAGSDSTSYVWSSSTGEQIYRFRSYCPVTSIQWSSSSMEIATANNSSTQTSSVILWSIIDGSKISTLSVNGTGITDLQWSPDDVKLSAGCSNGSCIIWDLGTGTANTLSVHKVKITTLQWSPDGTKIVTSSADRTAIIWDACTYTKLHSLIGTLDDWGTAEINGIDYAYWSPDGTKIATSGGSNAGFIWDASSGKVIDTLKSGDIAIPRVRSGTYLLQLRWNPDGKAISASCILVSRTNVVFIWKTNKPHTDRLLIGGGHWRSTRTATWSPDGTKIASAGDDGAISIWDAKLGTCLSVMEFYGFNTSVQWNPNSTKIVSVSTNNPAVVWDVTTGTLLYRMGASVNGAQWSPDGTKIATTSDILNNYFNIWDGTSGRIIDSISMSGGGLQKIQWNPAGTRISAATSQNGVRIADIATMKEMQQLNFHKKSVSAVTWCPDRTQLASSSWDSTVAIWNVTSLDTSLTFKTETGIIDSKWSPDQEMIATLQFENYNRAHLIIWSTSTGKRLFSMAAHNNNILNFRWSPDGKMIATIGYDSTASIWLASTGTKLFSTVGHTGFVRDVQWSPDSKHVATSSDDHSVKIWAAVEFTAVKEEAERIPTPNTFTIYPNPAINQFTLHFDQATRTESTLSLMNMLGQTVAEIALPTGCTEQIITTESLPVGMYIAKYNSSVQPMIKW